MSFRLKIKDRIRGRVTFSDSLHRTYPDTLSALRRPLIILGLAHALRWHNGTPYDTDSCDDRSVTAFLNSEESVTYFFRELRENADDAEREILDRHRSGRNYEWPVDTEEEIAVLMIAANTEDVEFEYQIEQT